MADPRCETWEMQDHELYRQILGIETPWFVDRVELKMAEGEVHVYVDHHDELKWPCPECGADRIEVAPR